MCAPSAWVGCRRRRNSSEPAFDRGQGGHRRQGAKDYVAAALKSGELRLSCEIRDEPPTGRAICFVWRSNLLGASGKGHEYFLKHLLGTSHGVLGKDLGATGAQKPSEVEWHDQAPEGKLDLLVTIDFRMSTTCMYSDIVLPTATWYEKNDLNTSDMHPFIHPLTSAVDPVWGARNDWEIYKGIAKAFSEVAPEVLGVEKDVVLTPIMHDTPGEIAQALDVKDWKRERSIQSLEGPCRRSRWSSVTIRISSSASPRSGR